MFREIRKRVKKRSKVGNTENCTGLRIYRAESSTRKPMVMLTARKRSNTIAGTGMIITRTVVTVATGKIHSVATDNFRAEMLVAVAIEVG
jgi:hypothetical protein